MALDQEADAATIIATLKAALPARAGVYDLDEVPADLPDNYVVIHISRRYVASRRGSGEVTLPGGRLMTRYIALTVGNCRLLRRRVTTALEDQILPGDIGPFTFESDEAIDLDEGWYVASDSWAF